VLDTPVGSGVGSFWVPFAFVFVSLQARLLILEDLREQWCALLGFVWVRFCKHLLILNDFLGSFCVLGL
jgi:hypothetical protein